MDTTNITGWLISFLQLNSLTLFSNLLFFCTSLYSLARTDIYDFVENVWRCELLNWVDKLPPGWVWVHYPLLLMLQFFSANLTFLSGKIWADTSSSSDLTSIRCTAITCQNRNQNQQHAINTEGKTCQKTGEQYWIH